MTSAERATLPVTVNPINYAVSIYGIKYVGSWSYSGKVVIDLSIKTSTSQIVLNARDLTLDAAHLSLQDGTSPIVTSSIAYDAHSQRVVLIFPSSLPSTAKASLTILFHGRITDVMAGFYRSKYRPAAPPDPSVPVEGDFCYMLSTQFEPCEARRAFPCFDEPALKATFDFEIEIPETLTAVSNMPVKKTKVVGGGAKVVSFERTPRMSTYLLCWCLGDFEYIEGFASRLHSDEKFPVRVFATRGLKDQCRFGLKETIQYLEFFNEIFQIEYPLPKMDCVVVHEVCNVAMENWGLMTFCTTTMLYDYVTSDVKFQNRVAYIIAHELAHQWFGDLVTMEWWNDIWLNEGFATWAGWYAVDHFHPDWNVWGQFNITALQKAFELDSLRTSHPIIVDVKDALDAGQVFDDISYLKGASILRMLSQYIGVETFLLGVSAYLKANAYSNATTQDLWKALTKASNIDVTKFMDCWTNRMGYPIISITEGEGRIQTHQSRLLLTGDLTDSDNGTIWPVPLSIKAPGEGNIPNIEVMLEKTKNLAPGILGPYSVVNPKQNGFYRIKYPTQQLLDYVTGKKFTHSELTATVGDLAGFAISGECSTATFLDLLRSVDFSDDYWLWSQALQSLSNIRSIFADNEKISTGLKRFTLGLVKNAADAMGWVNSDDEIIPRKQLRALLLTTAGGAGSQDIVVESKRRFALYTSGQDPSAIDPSLRTTIFSTVLSHGGSNEYHAVVHEYLTSPSIDAKDVCLTALGCIQDPLVILSYLDFVFAGNVTLEDIRICATSLAGNSIARRLLWKYIQENWSELQNRMGSNRSVLERFVKLCLSRFSDRQTLTEIDGFFGEKDTGGFERSLAVVKETVRANANYRERDWESVLGWLVERGYVEGG